MRKSILATCVLIHFSILLYSQDISFKSYQYSIGSSNLKFSMDIPASWKTIQQEEDNGFFQTFVETDSSGIAIRKLCLDSVIYKLRYFPAPVHQAIQESGFRYRGNNMFQYEIDNFIHAVIAFEMTGNNYSGLDCSFMTTLPCEGKKSRKKSEAMMVYLFFSNGKETICLTGNGIRLTESVLDQIESSFTFN